MTNADAVDAEPAILATGFTNQQESVRDLFRSDVAYAIGPVWGFDHEGEIRNVWRRTTQQNLGSRLAGSK